MFAAIDNLLFLLLIGIAALLKLLGKAVRSGSSSDQGNESSSPSPDRPANAKPPLSDEEQIRKFLEALGRPTSASAPPPLPPRTDVPARPLAPVSPPRSSIPLPRPRPRKPSPPSTGPADVPAQRSSGPVSGNKGPVPLKPVRPEAPVFDVHAPSGPVPSDLPITSAGEVGLSGDLPPGIGPQRTDILTMVGSLQRLREVIILREIFGPPRSLQPLDEAAGGP
jgi:hypothetical protein